MQHRGWRDRLYDCYITSGQAGFTPEKAEIAFASRAPWIRQVVARYLPDDRGVRILDLGCGSGAFLFVLRSMGFERATGVDTSREQVEAAEKMEIGGIIHADAQEHIAGVPTGSQDVALAIDLLEHLPRSQLLGLAEEVHRILRPGGRWLVHVPNSQGLFGAGVRDGDLTHERAFTPSSVQQLFRAARFERVEVHADPPVVHGAVSLCRRLVWTVGVLPLRILFAAETGCLSPVLTRNLLAVAYR